LISRLAFTAAMFAIIPWLVFHQAIAIPVRYMFLYIEWLLGQTPADAAPVLLSSASSF
jgi:hypothetical protein